MKYKLIAIDMDGTVLNSEHEVSEFNKKILNEVKDKNIKVVISTGRIFVSARYYAKLLGISTPIISCNGAYINGPINNDNIIIENPIEKEDVMYILKTLEENDLKYRFYDAENFYARSYDSITQKYVEWNKKLKVEDRINIEITESPFEIIERENVQILKFVVMDEDDDKLEKIKKILLDNANIDIVTSWEKSFDIMYKGVSKGSALKQLCDKLKIDRNEVIAIGDNENDMSMIEYAGLGIAMGNAEEIVKNIADYITDDNDNDGVAKAIQKFIVL